MQQTGIFLRPARLSHVVHIAADLAQFVQRRELMAYQQRLARTAYAYGVDLRRSAWLDHSTFGDPLMRSVDRRWNRLVGSLMEDTLDPPDKAVPIPVMEELARILKLLRAPLPSLRCLRSEVASDWPIVTVLGTTKGGIHWMVVDPDRLVALEPTARAFLFGSALGNLQCDHAPIFTAHLMTHRAGRGLGLVKAALRPWSRVAVFSADRAGLLAVAELEPAVEAMRAHGVADVPWLPSAPSMDLRERALRDFDKSRVMTRLRHSYAQAEDWSVAPARADEAKAEGTAIGDEAPREPVGVEAPSAAEPPPPPGPDPLEAELSSAWTLARCDALLTRRLGLF
jgi:hypothetical protein